MASLPPIVKEVVGRYRALLEAELPGRLLRLVVFGSMARGEAHEDSDVDLLVVLEDPVAFRERVRAMDLATEQGLARGLVLAPLVLSQSEWSELERRERRLVREVATDGVDA